MCQYDVLCWPSSDEDLAQILDVALYLSLSANFQNWLLDYYSTRLTQIRIHNLPWQLWSHGGRLSLSPLSQLLRVGADRSRRGSLVVS